MFTLFYTLNRHRNFSPLEILAARGNDIELEEEIEIEVVVEYAVYGQYRPSTWNDPAEYPEVELRDIYTYDDQGNRESFTLTPKEEDAVIMTAYESMHSRKYDDGW